MANIQIKLSIREDVLENLETALERFPESRTVNIIACEVIEDYLPLWLEAEAYRQKKVKRQHARVRKQREQKEKGKKAR
jgi:hypothetical protein